MRTKLLLVPGAVALLLIALHMLAARTSAAGSTASIRQPEVGPASPHYVCKEGVTPAPAPAGFVTRAIAPASTNPAIVGPPDCPHYVALSTTALRQPELFVFLPGTQLDPLEHRFLIHQAALNGYYAVGLSYPNLQSENATCSPAPGDYPEDPQCSTDFRREVITGQNTSPFVTVTVTNSIVSRLKSLVSHLDSQYPAEGWGQFLHPSGDIAWNKLRLGGHSQGSGHTALLATNLEVARACMFAGPGDNALYGLQPPAAGTYYTVTATTQQGEIVYYTLPPTWLTSTTATPAERIFGFVHMGDRPGETVAFNWRGMGFVGIAGVAGVDGAMPPYDGAHALTTSFPITRSGTDSAGDPDFAGPHGAVVKDDHVPLTARGLPLYAPVWQTMCFGDRPTPEPEPEPCEQRCPDVGDTPDGNNSLGNAMSIHPFGAVAQPAFYPTEYTGVAGTGPIHLNAGSNPNLSSTPRTAIDSALGLEVDPAGSLVSRVSNERNAFLVPDQDIRNRNILPAPVPANGRSNRDGFDNAFVHPNGRALPLSLNSCAPTHIEYVQYIHGPWVMNDFYAGPRYVNVWIDFNRDGDWLDTGLGGPCPERPTATVDEWLVRNLPAPATSGIYSLPAQLLPDLGDTRPLWLRISIAEAPAPAAGGGVGPAGGYQFGETEDHLLCYRPAKEVWADCPALRIALDGEGDGEVDGEMQVEAGKLLTLTAAIDDYEPSYPLTFTWTVYDSLKPVVAASGVHDSRVITQVLSAGAAQLPLVFGCAGECPAGTTPVLAQTVEVSTVDAEGTTANAEIIVKAGAQMYIPFVRR